MHNKHAFLNDCAADGTVNLLLVEFNAQRALFAQRTSGLAPTLGTLGSGQR